MSWTLSNETLLRIIAGLRTASNPDACDYADVLMYCDEAADVIEGMMKYESEHGLRSSIEPEDEE